MQYNPVSLIYEGKTKRLWATEEKKCAIAEFSDDAMMYHGKKKLYFEGKGQLCNQINSILLQVLEQNNIQTHFVQKYSANAIVVKRAEMIPMEVVVRNYAAGSMVERLGFADHSKLKSSVLELCYKNDQLRDPVINEYHALAMGLCTQEELSVMCYNAMRVNKVLTDLFKQIGIVVADFKLEFGRINGRLVVADEITPNVARLWDASTLRKFYDGTDNIAYEYQEILRRLQSVTTF